MNTKNTTSQKVVLFFSTILIITVLHENARAVCTPCSQNKLAAEIALQSIKRKPIAYTIDLSFGSLLSDTSKKSHAGFLQIKMILAGSVNNVISEYYFQGIYCILPGATNEETCRLQTISEDVLTIKGSPITINATINTGNGQNATVTFQGLEQINKIETNYSYQAAGNFSSLQFNF